MTVCVCEWVTQRDTGKNFRALHHHFLAAESVVGEKIWTTWFTARSCGRGLLLRGWAWTHKWPQEGTKGFWPGLYLSVSSCCLGLMMWGGAKVATIFPATCLWVCVFCEKHVALGYLSCRASRYSSLTRRIYCTGFVSCQQKPGTWTRRRTVPPRGHKILAFNCADSSQLKCLLDV